MAPYRILTDSCVDMTDQMAQELDLTVLPLEVEINGQRYRNYLDGREIGNTDFYNLIRSGKTGTTAAFSVGWLREAMEPVLQAGEDILFLCFSSGLSVSYNAVRLAGEELAAEYPSRTIRVIDTLCASMGQGLIVWLAAKRRIAGESLEAVAAYVEENIPRLCHWFTVEDLYHLKRGGRVSAATALLGTMLSIKPVLHVDDEGHLINMSKARGRKASIQALVDKMKETIIDRSVVFISHGDCPQDADYLAELVRQELGADVEIHVSYIGPVIGAHSGPGTLALFFLGSHR